MCVCVCEREREREREKEGEKDEKRDKLVIDSDEKTRMVVWLGHKVALCLKKLKGLWQVWFSGLSASVQTERSLVRFPVRAHAWVVGM